MSQTASLAQQSASFAPILVADIGGTNARFALITNFCANTSQFEIQHGHTFASSDFDSLEGAIEAYLATLNVGAISRACLAVAGPVKGQEVHLTNLGWHFHVDSLKAHFGFNTLKVINDFAAFAYAAPYLCSQTNLTIKQGQAQADANIAVFGPGTGFGAAALVRAQEQQAVLSCEAGHISLAAVTELDKKLLAELHKDTMHVSVETVFSGPGIARLYRAMAAVEGVSVQELDAASIAALAEQGVCEIASKTLNHFCDWIGSVAGDLALTFVALGGVYIGGGILPRMPERLVASRFIERFSAKGMMSQYNGQIPVTLVCQENIPFIGAAACIYQSE